MTHLTHDPYTPAITLGQLLAYDPERPETHLGSHFINHFLRVFLRLRSPRIEPIAEVMELDRRTVAAALKAETGLTFREWRERWEVFEWSLYIWAHGRRYDHADLARTLGYYDNSSLWRFRQTPRCKAIIAEHNRLSKEDPDYIRANKLGMERLKPIRDAREAEIMKRVREEMR